LQEQGTIGKLAELCAVMSELFEGGGSSDLGTAILHSHIDCALQDMIASATPSGQDPALSCGPIKQWSDWRERRQTACDIDARRDSAGTQNLQLSTSSPADYPS
jgi:hypothetical protein